MNEILTGRDCGDEDDTRELGVSLRFIQGYRQEVDFNAFDKALVSCEWLGHTFQYNENDEQCGICGMPKMN